MNGGRERKSPTYRERERESERERERERGNLYFRPVTQSGYITHTEGERDRQTETGEVWRRVKKKYIYIKRSETENILPSIGQENNIAQPKTDKWFSFTLHFSSVLTV